MTDLRKMVVSPTVWAGFLIIVSFWVWGPLFENDPQLEAMRVAAVVVGSSVVVAFVPGVIKFLTERYPVQAQQLVTGIVVLSIGIVGNGSWLLLWRMANFPEWMLHAEINGFWIWVTLAGFVLMLTAHRAIEDEVPKTDWVRLVVTFSVAIALSAFVGWYSPNLRPVADWLEPYFTEVPVRLGRG